MTILTLFLASLTLPHTWLGLVLMLVIGYLWGKGVGRREGYRAGYLDAEAEGSEAADDELPEDDNLDDDALPRPHPEPWE